MSQSGLHEGAIIPVSAFDGDEPLEVEIVSSRSIDSGSSAIILNGEMKPAGIGSPLFVALKVFPSVLNEVKRELFHRELFAARRLRHRSILPFIGTAVVGLHMIIVARFMQNGNMLQYLRQTPSSERKPLLLDIAHAVHFLHVWAGVIHGDLKCENVLISDAGKALLADFGLSTLVDKAESSTTTATGIRQQNTIRFAAPELLLGEPDDEGSSTTRQRSKSTKSDVYAFGMLIIQAYTGNEPWPGCNLHAVMRNVCMGHIHPRPGENAVSFGFNNSLWKICLSTWTFDYSKRPNMAEIVDQLQPEHQLSSELAYNDPVSKTLGWFKDPVRSVAVIPGSKRIAFCTDGGQVAVIDGCKVLRTTRHRHQLTCLALLDDGRSAVTGSSDTTLQIWDLETGDTVVRRRLRPMKGHTRPVTCVAVSAATKRVVSGSCDDTVRLWDSLTGKAVGGPLIGHTHRVRAVAFSPNGAIVASGSQDCTVRLWSQHGEQALPPLRGHEGHIISVAFSPDGSMLASGAMDDTVRLWDVKTGAMRRVLVGHRDYVTCVAFSPTGRYLASAGWDNCVRLWDAETGSAVGKTIKEPNQAVMSVSTCAMCISFFPRGKSLVLGYYDGYIRQLTDILVPRKSSRLWSQ